MPTRHRAHCEERQKDAKTRQEDWTALSFEQQLAILDVRLGKGLGATKQRARIAKQIVERDKPQPEKKKQGKQRRQRRQDKK
jgi:hypothetical protein